MAKEYSLDRRIAGKFYTPKELANFLVSPLPLSQGVSIFDPAYGDGSLLRAASSALSMRGIRDSARMIHGCDKDPFDGHLDHLPPSNLKKMDFFDYSFEQKFDVILMNPPYVRHHFISENTRSKYQSITSAICQLNSKTDLWGYFLTKAVAHVRIGGSIGAILPWSFLQADYAIPIRKWLADSFGQIEVHALSGEYFEGANERVVIVWLKNRGKSALSIRIGFTPNIGAGVSYSDVSINAWTSSTVLFSNVGDIQDVLQEYQSNHNFRPLGDIADIKIGVVTGADDYFILREAEALKLGFQRNDLVPIIRSSREFNGLFLNGNEIPYRLLGFSNRPKPKYKVYLQKGLAVNIDQRYHARNREPWYLVEPGRIPDAFFPYRATLYPYIVLNNGTVQSTNSVHRLYFKGINVTEQQWIQISLLSAPGQLSLEAYSKCYGNGFLKTEPKGLKAAIVHKGVGKPITQTYHNCSVFIKAGNRHKAVELATTFINNSLDIPDRLSRRTSSALEELQRRRITPRGV